MIRNKLIGPKKRINNYSISRTIIRVSETQKTSENLTSTYKITKICIKTLPQTPLMSFSMYLHVYTVPKFTLNWLHLQFGPIKLAHLML